MNDLTLAGRSSEVHAVEYVRNMRGGSKPILYKASDGYQYVTKLTNNRQGIRCVVNDLFASILAAEIGLPVPPTALITIPTEIQPTVLPAASTEAMPYFGSRVPVDPAKLALYDVWPRRLAHRISNAGEAAGCWIFDVWTANADGFQYIVHRHRGGPYRFWKIDHGFCFTAHHWVVPDSVRIPGGWQAEAMSKISTMADFEPYISRIRAFPFERLQRIAALVPRVWLRGDEWDFESLLFALAHRAEKIEERAVRCWPSDKLGELRKPLHRAAANDGGTSPSARSV